MFSGKVNAHYFAKEDFTTNSSKCICIRKGEVGQLLEVQALGWWKMNVEGVVGWTPGEFWDLLQVILTPETRSRLLAKFGKCFFFFISLPESLKTKSTKGKYC